MLIRFKTIKIGDIGKNVEEIAKLLAKAGSTIKPTSDFHIGMYSAVKAFQRRNSIKPTGKVDRKTWDTLHIYKYYRKSKK